jgi:hypothetical protein
MNSLGQNCLTNFDKNTKENGERLKPLFLSPMLFARPDFRPKINLQK